MSNRSIKTLTRFRSVAALVCISFLSIAAIQPAQSAELIWVGDFETGDYSQYKPKMLGEGFRSNRNIVTSQVRGGKYATELIIENVEYEGSVKERAELLSRVDVGGAILFHWDGPEYWVGLSFFFQEWNADAWTFFQIHAPDTPIGSSCLRAGNAISLIGTGAADKFGVDDTISLDVLDHGGISEGNGSGSNNTRVASHPLQIGVWHDYVMNFKLSTKGDGYFKVWKNGEVIYSRTGLTNVNQFDSCGEPILDYPRHNGVHVGLYTDDSPQYRRIFYDEVRVAEGPDGYSSVAPGGDGAQSSSRPLPPQFSQAN